MKRVLARIVMAQVRWLLKAEPRTTEMDDVLAYLDRRIANHEKVAGNPTGSQERARWLVREVSIIRDYLANGLHLGDAAIGEMLAGKDG